MACTGDSGKCRAATADRTSTPRRGIPQTSGRFATLLLTLVTFNVLGLSKSEKRHDLIRDCYVYGVDILAIQETKCKTFEDTTIDFVNPDDGSKLKYRLLISDQNNSLQAGLGFVISPKVNDFVTSYHQISDRVCFLDLEIPVGPNCVRHCRVVNCYASTLPKSTANPQLATTFYNHLNKAMDVSSKWDLYVLGDFNAKIGKRSQDDVDNGLDEFIGRFGNGQHNSNGQHLLDFLVKNSLFAINTAFKHPMRHITTRCGWLKDWSAGVRSKKTIPYYTQIDYILCRNDQKSMFSNARSFSGTLTKSDHKLVLARLSYGKIYNVLARRQSSKRKLDITNLVANPVTKADYQQVVNQLLLDQSPADNPNEEMNQMISILKQAAEETVGYQKKTQGNHYYNDPGLQDLSARRHKLRLQLLNNNKSADRTSLRAKINRIQSETKKRLKILDESRASILAEEISSTDNTRRMFEATRQLAGVKRNKTVAVLSECSQMLTSDQDKANSLKEWFEKKFCPSNVEPIKPFEDEPRPLAEPLTNTEVQMAAKSMKNGRATGPDSVPSELVKYACPEFYTRYASCINKAFETHSVISSIGEGTITPLQKPNKPHGPLQNIRPLTLSNCSRKLLSMITPR